MKHGPILVMMLFVMFTGFANAQMTSPSDQVRDVLLKNVAGFERGDFAAVEPLWAHGEDVTVIENGRANYGCDFRDHHLKPELAHVKNLKYTLSDIRTNVAGTLAWSTFKFSMSSGEEGAKRERNGVGTAILENRGDGWKIVHWHSSTPRTNMPPPTTATQ